MKIVINEDIWEQSSDQVVSTKVSEKVWYLSIKKSWDYVDDSVKVLVRKRMMEYLKKKSDRQFHPK